MKLQKKEGKVSETSERRLKQIYVAAAQLFCDKGFEATSMSNIAEAVGLTKAGVYHFVPGGKKDLLYAVLNFGFDRVDEEVTAPARAIADPEQRLRTILINHAKLIARGSDDEGHNPLTVIVEEVVGLSPAHLRKINQRKRAYFDLIRATLQQLKDDGRLKDIDLTVASFSLIGMLLWLSRWFRADGRLTREQVAEEICKIALGGLLRPEARLRRKKITAPGDES